MCESAKLIFAVVATLFIVGFILYIVNNFKHFLS